MSDEIKEALEKAREASAWTEKVWQLTARWAMWAARVPVMILCSMAAAWGSFLAGILLCHWTALPFWFPYGLMPFGLLLVTIFVRRGELTVEIAWGKIQANLRGRKEAKTYLPTTDTETRRALDQICQLKDLEAGWKMGIEPREEAPRGLTDITLAIPSSEEQTMADR